VRLAPGLRDLRYYETPAVDLDHLQRPSSFASGLDLAHLRGHFVLGRSVQPVAPGWALRTLDGWQLAHDPDLPALDVVDLEGTQLGWVLGHPIDLEARGPAQAPLRAPLVGGDAASPDRVEPWVYRYAGRFALVLLRPFERVYPDAVASLPVLFSEGHGRVTSSPFLLGPAEALSDDPLVDVVEIASTDRCFILGSTPVRGAANLLPNHVLELRTWRARRHWPSEMFEEDSVEAGLRRVGETLEATMTALAAREAPHVSLTAGIDTRALLACSRDIRDRLRFFTLALPDDYGAIDLMTASRIAGRFGLDHRSLVWHRPHVADVERFAIDTGCMIGEQRGRLAGPTFAQLGRDGVHVSGIGGEEVGGVRLGTGGWRPGDQPGTILNGADLVARAFFPPDPDLVRRADEWLASLPVLDTIDTIALFQLEMRVGCRGGTLTTAYPDAYTFTAYPFGHRSIIDASFRFPLGYREEARVRQDLIRARWPELLDFGFNRLPVKVAARQVAARYAPGFVRRTVRRLKLPRVAAV
jgi:hypothetical protein